MPEQPSRDNGTTPPYLQYGSGGGDGQYVFADLEQLDGIIAALDAELCEMREDDRLFQQAISLIDAPAADHMSVAQVKAYRSSLRIGWRNHKEMVDYVENQFVKLRAARQAYEDSDTVAAERLRDISEADG